MLEPSRCRRVGSILLREDKSVATITTLYEGQRFAMVASTVDSLSLDPPSLLVCVNRTTSIFPALAARIPFCVNLLAEHHHTLAQHCAKTSGEERFAKGDWLTHVNGVPYLADAQSNIFCKQDGHIDYGSHGIFIGRIADVVTSRNVEPLVYADGRYAKIMYLGQEHA